MFFLWQPLSSATETKKQFSLSPKLSFEIAQASEGGFVPLHRRQNTKPFEADLIPVNSPSRRDTQSSEINTDDSSRPHYKAFPGITIVTPSGYGASWGSVGLGVGFQESVRNVDRSDGASGMGFGLGDARKLVGLQVGLGFPDISNPFEDGTLSLKLHRQIDPNLSFALGASGVLTWGSPDGGSSLYGVATKRIPLTEDRTAALSEFTVSLGMGGGQFRSLDNVDNDVDSVGVFGSLAVRVIEPVSAIAEWSGQDLTVGVSIVPFRNLPWVITPALTDLTGTAGDKVRFIFGTGYSFSF